MGEPAQLHGLEQGSGLVMGHPVATLGDGRVLGLLGGVPSQPAKAAGFLGVVLNPGLDAFDQRSCRPAPSEADSNS